MVLCVFLQRSQHDTSVRLLALSGVEPPILDVFEDGVGQQVPHAVATPQPTADVCGRHVVGHPLAHHVDAAPVRPEEVRALDEAAHVKAATGDARQSVGAHDLLHVLVLPQPRYPEGLQHISATQQQQMWPI